MGAFEDFVNIELPKRIGTNDAPTAIPAGMVPVSTGVGLLTTFIEFNTGNVFSSGITSIDTSSHRVMSLGEDGLLYYTNVELVDRCIGISTHSALNNNFIKLQSTGEISEQSWNWIPGKPIFARQDGFLSQTNDDLFVLIIGHALSSTKILLKIETPIIL